MDLGTQLSWPNTCHPGGTASTPPLFSPPLLWLLAFALRCSYVECIHIYNCYVFLDWSLDHYIVSFLVSCNSVYFKVYFVWYEYCYPSFLLISICMEYLFPSLTSNLYVSLGLKWGSCRQHIYGSCFCIHSANLCLLVGAFNPFIFKVIVDMYVSTAIFLIVSGLFL